ncbi:conserved hypothetical protein [Ricinus communis]|uniref:Uncharacterized protein n=1 Tax=Ricinus communis TaxID=3988 RepID=B9TNW4_RICCO|nr:conserved hypothetical protein [Ricinus communis]
MRNGRRPIEIRARLAHCPVGIDELRNGPRCRPCPTRLAQGGQVNDKEVDHAAQAREQKQDQQPVHVLLGAHGMHRKEQGDDDVKADSEDAHLTGSSVVRRCRRYASKMAERYCDRSALPCRIARRPPSRATPRRAMPRPHGMASHRPLACTAIMEGWRGGGRGGLGGDKQLKRQIAGRISTEFARRRAGLARQRP